MDALTFFEELYPDPDVRGFLPLWTKEQRNTRWFTLAQLKRAAKYVEEVAETNHDIYFGVGLHRTRPRTGRGKADTVCAIPGAWVDLDVADPGHKSGKHYFPTKEAAHMFLRNLPVKPTLIVDTGGGLHGWWLFKELFEIENEKDRQQAETVTLSWQAFLRRQAAEFDIDPTADLARVMRPVGSINAKTGKPRPVRLLGNVGPRCNPSDLLDWAPKVVSSPLDESVEIGKVILTATANPPSEKLLGVMEDRIFKQTWDRKRSELKDQSPSAYCMALANIAAMAGWEEQEIVDLLIAWRRKEGANLNLDRPEWYQGTLGKAFAVFRKESERSQAIESLTSTTPEETTEVTRLKWISQAVGFAVLGVIKKVPLDPSGFVERPVYILTVEKGGVPFKIRTIGAEPILRSERFAVLAAEHMGVVLPPIKRKDWCKIAQAILDVAVEIEAPPESGTHEDMRSMLREYQTQSTIAEDPARASELGAVLRQNGTLSFPWKDFIGWLRTRQNIRKSNQELSEILQALGCERRIHENLLTGRGRRTKATFWTFPIGEDEG